jgi:septum formation protein
MPADPTLDRRRTAARRHEASLVLASASPRRADLLQAAGIAFDVIPADLDETPYPGERAEPHVRRLATMKAEAIARAGERRPILGADTVVVIDDRILGKPVDVADARRMLAALSGRTHTVLTGVAIIAPANGADGPDEPRPAITSVSETRVEFAALSAADIDWYVASGEPMGKAGAYAIQGLASRFVTRIDGSYSNVVGLPIAHVHAMCRSLGILLS